MSEQFAKVPLALVRSGIGVAPIATWVLLRSRARQTDEGLICWPGIESIASDLGCSESTVKRAIQTLRLAGWLSVKKRYGRSNKYLLHESPSVRSNRPHQSGRYDLTELDEENQIGI